MSSGLAVLILLVSALAAMLAGMSVFSSSRPPDNRPNQIMDELDELKGLLNQIQKSVLQLERKIEKEHKETRTEFKDALEKATEHVDRRIQELSANL